jgi:fucose 4-O-acetylase-like acetyltransferase
MNRNPIYDRARGIGMLLVIYGHIFRYGGVPFSFIFSFHMPLFFVISGMLISKTRIESSYSEWAKHIVKRYLPPLVFFSILGGIVNAVFFKTPDFRQMCKDFILHMSSDELLTGAIWFLSMLGFVMLLMPLLIKLQKKVNWGGHFYAVVITTLSLLAYLLSKIPYTLPFLIKTIPIALLFVYIGYTFKSTLLELANSTKAKRAVLYTFPLFVVLVFLNRTVNLAIPVYNDFLVYMFCALYGTLMTMQISTYKLPRFIDYLGEHSLIVFSLHAIWITAFVTILNHFMGTSYAPMVDIPFLYVLGGGLLVIAFTALSTALILPVYNATLKLLKLK